MECTGALPLARASPPTRAAGAPMPAASACVATCRGACPAATRWQPRAPPRRAAPRGGGGAAGASEAPQGASRRTALLGAAGCALAQQRLLSPREAQALTAFVDVGACDAPVYDGGACDDAVAGVLRGVVWDEESPFDADDFERYDMSSDTLFYDSPRFVKHVDDSALAALTAWYARSLPASGSGAAVLDICSSWVSHYPEGYTNARVAGLGMNEEELARNPVLTEHVVHDLNADPRLPYEDESFDYITNCVSVDYLTRPLEVFEDLGRVLKPGGTAVMSFSNRFFPSKVIAGWGSSSDLEHVWTVGAYFHYGGKGRFEPAVAEDLTPRSRPLLSQDSDPMYVVFATKKSA